MFPFIQNSLRFVHYRLVAFPLLAAGPCFNVNIHTNVKVERDGSSARRTTITTNEPKHARLATELPRIPEKDFVLAILTKEKNFDKAATEALDDLGNGDRWVLTQNINVNEPSTDLSLVRKGADAGASNEAIVSVDQYLIFQRIRYKETIRDNATRESMTTAAEKITTQFSEALKLASRELLSASFDLKVLENYLQTTFRKDFREFLVRIIAAREDFVELLRVFGDSLTAAGIPYDFNAFDKFIKNQSLDVDESDRIMKSIVDGMLTKLASLLRRPGATPENPGEPIKPEELILLKTPKLIEQAIERAIQNQSNSKIKGFEELMQSAGSDLFGSFGGALFDPDLGSAEIRWKTTLQMPGRLLKTSGVPLEDQSVLWYHLRSDLAARANEQVAESIVLDNRAIATLGGNVSNITAADLLEMIATLGDGRERTPNRECLTILKNALDGTEESITKMKKFDRLKPVRRILQIDK